MNGIYLVKRGLRDLSKKSRRDQSYSIKSISIVIIFLVANKFKCLQRLVKKRSQYYAVDAQKDVINKKFYIMFNRVLHYKMDVINVFVR